MSAPSHLSIQDDKALMPEGAQHHGRDLAIHSYDLLADQDGIVNHCFSSCHPKDLLPETTSGPGLRVFPTNGLVRRPSRRTTQSVCKQILRMKCSIASAACKVRLSGSLHAPQVDPSDDPPDTFG